jgi:hypothetical protein
MQHLEGQWQVGHDRVVMISLSIAEVPMMA